MLLQHANLEPVVTQYFLYLFPISNFEKNNGVSTMGSHFLFVLLDLLCVSHLFLQVYVLYPKQDLHGLGFDPYKHAPEFRGM